MCLVGHITTCPGAHRLGGWHLGAVHLTVSDGGPRAPTISVAVSVGPVVTGGATGASRTGDGAGGAGGGAGVEGRGRGGGTAACRARVGGLISRAAKEAMLQSPQWADAGGGLILQHAQHQVLEAEVVGGAVARLPRPPAPGPARLHAQHLLQPPCPGALVILPEFLCPS